jgi:hypothetical protein
MTKKGRKLPGNMKGASSVAEMRLRVAAQEQERAARGETAPQRKLTIGDLIPLVGASKNKK